MERGGEAHGRVCVDVEQMHVGERVLRFSGVGEGARLARFAARRRERRRRKRCICPRTPRFPAFVSSPPRVIHFNGNRRSACCARATNPGITAIATRGGAKASLKCCPL